MGAQQFLQRGRGENVAKAFKEAQDDAFYEYGHRGYTGSLAEKDGYIIIDATPKTGEEANDLANKLLDEGDGRIDDKWGPAGAIRVKDEKYDGWLFFGWASC